MIWFILAIFVTIIAWVMFRNDYDGGSAVFMTFCISMIAAGLAQPLVRSFVQEPAPNERNPYVELQNLGDGMGVEGHFFLGGGSVESSPAYMYYSLDNGRYKLHYKYSWQSYVTYTDGTPKMIIKGTEYNNKWITLDGGWNGPGENQPDAYEFQVPPGSVQQNFNLDAQ